MCNVVHTLGSIFKALSSVLYSIAEKRRERTRTSDSVAKWHISFRMAAVYCSKTVNIKVIVHRCIKSCAKSWNRIVKRAVTKRNAAILPGCSSVIKNTATGPVICSLPFSGLPRFSRPEFERAVHTPNKITTIPATIRNPVSYFSKNALAGSPASDTK